MTYKWENDPEATFGDTLGPAMEITDQAEADDYFECLVQRSIRYHGTTREKAISNQKINLGYYAGYYDHDTRCRVEKLFYCAHPYFGIASERNISAEEALQIGKELGKKEGKL